MIFIGESYLFDFSFYMQSSQSAVKVVRPAFLEEQSPRLWVRQEIVYMHWYSLWAQSSSSRLMPVCWFVRAKSQHDDCVVLGFFPVPGVFEKWSAHAAQVQKNIQTASELCKHETQKRWKKYLNEVWMWIQINICGAVQTQCLWLSLMVFTTKVLQKAAACTVAFAWWLCLIVQELRESMSTLSVTFFVCDLPADRWLSVHADKTFYEIQNVSIAHDCGWYVTVKQVFSPRQLHGKIIISHVWVQPRLPLTLAQFQILVTYCTSLPDY